MENTDNWNECFMPVVSSENNYDLNEEDKQYLIEFVPIKYNNNLSYSPKEENQFKKKV